MANLERGSTPQRKIERRLVFDEKKGKWRMITIGGNRGGHQRGQPISPEHVRKMHDGLKRFRQQRREQKMP